MLVEVAALGAALKGDVPSLTLIHGDETLLVEEACDLFLRAAQAQGFSEREIRFTEAGFAWESVWEDARSMSLFGGRKVIDVRLTHLRMEGSASEVLKSLARDTNPDTRVLLRAGELKSDQRKTAWYKSLEQNALVVHIRPVEAGRFKPWLVERLRRAQVQLDHDALELFSTCVEGNLLAAMQEIERMKLLGDGKVITRDMLAGMLEDSSHHNGFAFIDALLAGDGERVVRILNGLRSEGQSLFGPLYLLVSTLRRIGKGEWIPDTQKRFLPAFRRRAGSLEAVLAECALLDLQGKGQLTGDAWESLLNLALRLCGKPMPDLDSRRVYFTRL
jgi:DNA polymerase III subunit delta